jgi:hypothetical protein
MGLMRERGHRGRPTCVFGGWSNIWNTPFTIEYKLNRGHIVDSSPQVQNIRHVMRSKVSTIMVYFRVTPGV